jgi:hypothetical protein
MDDVPAQPDPEARSPRERRAFDTSFSERLESANLRKAVELDRETGEAGRLSRAAAGEPLPGGEGNRSAELRSAQDSTSEAEFRGPSPQEDRKLPPEPREPDNGGTRDGSEEPDQSGTVDSLARAGHLVVLKPESSRNEEDAREPLSTNSLALATWPEERRVPVRKHSAPWRLQILLLGSVLVGIAAAAGAELSRTRAEMAARALGWTEDRRDLEADLFRLQQVNKQRDGELSLLRQDAERSAAVAQRETDALRQTAADARAKLQATAAALSLREEQLMKLSDALSTAEARIGELTQGTKAGQGTEADGPKELPARLEAAENIADEATRPKSTQGGAAATFDPLDSVQPQPVDATALKGVSQQAPAKADQPPAASGQLPAMLEARDPDASTSMHDVIGPERAMDQTAGADSRSGAGLDALRAALTATRYQTEGR